MGRGALVFGAGLAEDFPGAVILPGESDMHPALWAIACAQSFYGLVEAVARARGRDPDRPPHLAKVTNTL